MFAARRHSGAMDVTSAQVAHVFLCIFSPTRTFSTIFFLSFCFSPTSMYPTHNWAWNPQVADAASGTAAKTSPAEKLAAR